MHRCIASYVDIAQVKCILNQMLNLFEAMLKATIVQRVGYRYCHTMLEVSTIYETRKIYVYMHEKKHKGWQNAQEDLGQRHYFCPARGCNASFPLSSSSDDSDSDDSELMTDARRDFFFSGASGDTG